MAKYVNAELYKVMHRRHPYLLTLILLALAGFFMLMLRVESAAEVDGVSIRVSVSAMANILAASLSLGLYLLLVAADAVFSEQYKHNTLKNEVSYGLPRLRIYFGKLFASILMAFALCAILIGGYLALSFAFFPAHEETAEILMDLGKALLMSVPLWLGGLGFFHMLQFLMKGSFAAIVYVMVIAILGSDFLELMKMFLPSIEPLAKLVHTCSLNTPFNLMNRQGPEELMGYAWALGMSWFTISAAVGALGFHKKEIS